MKDRVLLMMASLLAIPLLADCGGSALCDAASECVGGYDDHELDSCEEAEDQSAAQADLHDCGAENDALNTCFEESAECDKCADINLPIMPGLHSNLDADDDCYGLKDGDECKSEMCDLCDCLGKDHDFCGSLCD